MNAIDLFTDDDIKLAEHAAVIRTLGKRVVHDVIEIGRRLIECESLCKAEGRWLQWINDEFGWKRMTADNLINVAKASGKVPNFGTLNVPVSGLYLLAAPSTPAEVIDAVVERSEHGDRLTLDEVKAMIEESRAKDQATSAEELQRRIDAERAKAAEREREIRADYDGKLVIDADELTEEIDKANKPLHAKIKQLERQLERHQKAEERRKSGTQPKIDANISLRATVVKGRLGDLCAAVTITPAQLIEVERATAEVTGQTFKARLKQDVAHAEATLAWLQQFITAFQEATR